MCNLPVNSEPRDAASHLIRHSLPIFLSYYKALDATITASLSTRSQDITMMSQEFNSGFLVSFASGVMGKELLDETTMK